MRKEFQGKVALVTGSTRGIGSQIAKDFKDQGATVIGIGSNDVDFRFPEQVESFAKTLPERIDICINNAGMLYTEMIGHFDHKKYDNLMNVNLKSIFVISKAVSQRMVGFGYGRIINIASIAGTRVRNGRTAYSASKHALIGLTKASAVDLAPHGITVNAISPGFTMTEMAKTTLSKEDINKLISQIPLGRFASTKDISNAVLFLAKADSSYITGQEIIVDGGFVNSIII